MPNTELQHLIKMINQIADNIVLGESDESAATALASHITRFWARPMKQKIISYADSDGEKLQGVAREALAQLAEQMQDARVEKPGQKN